MLQGAGGKRLNRCFKPRHRTQPRRPVPRAVTAHALCGRLRFSGRRPSDAGSQGFGHSFIVTGYDKWRKLCRGHSGQYRCSACTALYLRLCIYAGLTLAVEASGATHLNPRTLDPEKATSIGPPVPNCEAQVVDIVSGASLGPKEQGEICVRGPNIMRGYLNRPDATAQSIDAEGWYHTGDIGYADEDGYFFVVDRLKELIKFSGYQVAPAELEAVLVSHPAVADAAVIPSPDEEHGEIPKAFVVRKGELSEQEVMD